MCNILVVAKDLNQLVLEFENIPIVREVPNVFLEELAKLPIDREIEFTRDPVPRIEPISIPPYRMTLLNWKS